MKITRINTGRHRAMLAIALFACVQIIMGFTLIMGDNRAPDTNYIYSAQAENIILTNVSMDINNDIEWR